MGTTIIPKYDYLASTTGACIVPSCGFDSVPSYVSPILSILIQPDTFMLTAARSDLSVYQALRVLQTSNPGATIKKSTSFIAFPAGGTISGGTFQSMHSNAETPKSEANNGEWSLVIGRKLLPRPFQAETYRRDRPVPASPLVLFPDQPLTPAQAGGRFLLHVPAEPHRRSPIMVSLALGVRLACKGRQGGSDGRAATRG